MVLQGILRKRHKRGPPVIAGCAESSSSMRVLGRACRSAGKGWQKSRDACRSRQKADSVKRCKNSVAAAGAAAAWHRPRCSKPGGAQPAPAA